MISEEEAKELEEMASLTTRTSVQILSDPEVPKALAKFLWVLYKKLQDKGFSEKQAFEIVLRSKFPIME